MRGIRSAGVGIGIALSSGIGFGQQASPAPAARIGRIVLLDQPTGPQPANIIIRSQATDSPQPMPGTTPPGGGNLSMPRPLSGPSVTELRTPNSTTPPAYQLGQPIPIGPPVAVGPPVVVGTPTTTGQALFPAPVAPSVLPVPDATPTPDAPLYGNGAYSPTTLLTGPQRLLLDAEFLLWWVRGGSVPPLVTTSSPAYNGILGQGDTRTLLADSFGNTTHTGARFGAIYWLTPQQCWGVDGNIFFLNRSAGNVLFNSVNDPLLARPFFNANQGIPYSELVAAPGLAVGAVNASTETSLWGADVNLRRALACAPCARLDIFGGFRYLSLNDEVLITESFARTAASPRSIGVPTALSGTVTDRFRTTNDFYGAQIGLAGEIRRGRWFAQGRAVVAMGTVFQTLQVNGVQVIQFENGPAVFPGGLLAQPGANMGTYSQRKFGVLPEVGFKLGYYVTPRMRLAVGYNFLYLNSVLRAGQQIDPTLDVTRIPNFPLPGNIQPAAGVHPSVPLKTTDAFVQGISFSLQYIW